MSGFINMKSIAPTLKHLLPSRLPELFLWFFAVVFSLGQLQRIQLGAGLTTYFHEVLLIAWLIGWGLTHHQLLYQLYTQLLQLTRPENITKLKRWCKNYRWEIVLFLWILLGMIKATLLSSDPIPWLYLARTTAYAVFIMTLTHSFRQRLSNYSRIWLVIGLVTLTLSLIQYLFVPDLRFLSVLGWDDHYYRLAGTLLDPAFTGMILVLALIYLLFSHWLAPHREFKLVVALIFVLGLALTFSRASYLAFLAVPTLGWLLTNRRILNKKANPTWLWPTLVAALIILVWLAPKPAGEGVRLERTASITARLNTATQTLQGWKLDDLLLGRGLFTVKSAEIERDTPFIIPNHARQPDNLILFVLMGTGVPGLGLTVVLAIKWLKHLAFRKPGIFIALIATIIHSQFNHTLFQPFVWLYLLGTASSLAITENGRSTRAR
jgi:hypothetical protein